MQTLGCIVNSVNGGSKESQVERMIKAANLTIIVAVRVHKPAVHHRITGWDVSASNIARRGHASGNPPCPGRLGRARS